MPDPRADPPGIRYTKDGHVATMILDRPHRGNALTRAMRPVVDDIWRDVCDDSDIRVLIITGTGTRHFCTGLDLIAPDSAGGTSDGSGSVADDISWSPLHAGVWKPVVCAVNGLVAGGGLHFVAEADIVVAGTHVELMDTHTTIGMVGAVENIALTARLPIGAVLQMTLMGRHYRLTARRAYQLGLIDELVESGAELATARDIADRIAANSPAATRLSKQAIWSARLPGIVEAQEFGWSLARSHRLHPDFHEGSRAFVERRPPQWVP